MALRKRLRITLVVPSPRVACTASSTALKLSTALQSATRQTVGWTVGSPGRSSIGPCGSSTLNAGVVHWTAVTTAESALVERLSSSVTLSSVADTNLPRAPDTSGVHSEPPHIPRRSPRPHVLGPTGSRPAGACRLQWSPCRLGAVQWRRPVTRTAHLHGIGERSSDTRFHQLCSRPNMTRIGPARKSHLLDAHRVLARVDDQEPARDQLVVARAVQPTREHSRSPLRATPRRTRPPDPPATPPAPASRGHRQPLPRPRPARHARVTLDRGSLASPSLWPRPSSSRGLESPWMATSGLDG